MVKGKFFCSILILLLILPAVSAFTYQVEPVLNTIKKDENALFRVILTNPLGYEDWFTISTRDVNWVLTSEPSLLKLSAGMTGQFEIILTPKPNLAEGNVYLVPVKIKSEKTFSFREESSGFVVFLGTPGNKSYAPTVTPSLIIEKVVDPRQPISVKVNLRNRNPRDLDGLTVFLRGGVEIDRSFETNLLPLEDKVNEILFRIDPQTAPGKRTLELRIMFGSEVIGDSTAEYEVLGYVDMQESASKKASLFKEENTFVITNKGNMIGTAQKAFSIGFLERLFTRYTPDAAKERGSDGRTYYVIRSQISSNEKLIIYSTEDYRLLAAIIASVLVLAILYFILRSPVIVYKSATPLGKATQEGLSEVKVRLYLKNRSGKQVTNIRITDTVPSIADIKKTSHIGSMEPVNISKGKRGTLARWEFASLEPYEERVIAYKIESKLRLVGGIRLPSAKARFDSAKGSERVTYSNQVNIVLKVEEKDE